MEAELFEVKMENIDETLQPLLPIPFLIFLLSLLIIFFFSPFIEKFVSISPLSIRKSSSKLSSLSKLS